MGPGFWGDLGRKTLSGRHSPARLRAYDLLPAMVPARSFGAQSSGPPAFMVLSPDSLTQSGALFSFTLALERQKVLPKPMYWFGEDLLN